MNQFVDQVVRLAYFYFIIIIIIILPALSQSRCFESSNSKKFRQKMTMTTAECTDYNRDKTNGLLITLYTFLHTNKRSSIKTKKKKPTNGNPEREKRSTIVWLKRQTRRSSKKQINTSFSSIVVLFPGRLVYLFFYTSTILCKNEGKIGIVEILRMTTAFDVVD